VPSSSFPTVGTPDSNGAGAGAIGSVRYDVLINAPPTPSDVLINVSTTDVRCKPGETACGSHLGDRGFRVEAYLGGTRDFVVVGAEQLDILLRHRYSDSPTASRSSA
jgi:hypothetical protein